jgi:formate-dependent nitrite reductase membrane component NrfD
MRTERIQPTRHLRGLRPQEEWREIPAIYLYLAGMGAGSYVIGTLLNWFVAPSKVVSIWGLPFDLAKAAVLWGPIVVAIGAPFLILDLGIKKRFLYAALNPRTSWVAFSDSFCWQNLFCLLNGSVQMQHFGISLRSWPLLLLSRRPCIRGFY